MTDVEVSVCWFAFPSLPLGGFWAAGLKVGDEYRDVEELLVRGAFRELREEQLSEVYTAAVEALKTLGITRFKFVLSPRNG